MNISLKKEKKNPNNRKFLLSVWMVFIFPKQSEADGDGKDAGRFPWAPLMWSRVGQLRTSGVNVGEGKETFLQRAFRLK